MPALIAMFLALPVSYAADLVKEGQAVYQASCTACHNPNPKQSGSLGPAIYGSSKELLEARVLRAEYPPGYKPKRATKTMPTYAHLKDKIPALHAFLNAK